ncbi:hypothetical protein Salat_0915100 [Sesamum alatum]|uniref:Uncharacterized protein n=1 Tax=Sesamum alatum TaxID=300844 RepID=A0AAE1YJS1_9LAMI|nr:hypothetical protein Salat_0915100 [Sesamum alatum]
MRQIEEIANLGGKGPSVFYRLLNLSITRMQRRSHASIQTISILILTTAALTISYKKPGNVARISCRVKSAKNIEPANLGTPISPTEISPENQRKSERGIVGCPLTYAKNMWARIGQGDMWVKEGCYGNFKAMLMIVLLIKRSGAHEKGKDKTRTDVYYNDDWEKPVENLNPPVACFSH